MNRFAALALVALTSAVLLAGVSLACPTWPTAVGFDIWNLPDLERQLAGHLRAGEVLDKQLAAAGERVWTKHRTVADLVANRLTLIEAAARFQAIDKRTSCGPATLACLTQSVSSEQAACVKVLKWVEAHLNDEPSFQAATLARLQGELREHFRKDDAVHLTN